MSLLSLEVVEGDGSNLRVKWKRERDATTATAYCIPDASWYRQLLFFEDFRHHSLDNLVA